MRDRFWKKAVYMHSGTDHFIPLSSATLAYSVPHAHSLCFHSSMLWPTLFPLLEVLPPFLYTYIWDPKTFLTISAQNDMSCLEIHIEPIVSLPVTEIISALALTSYVIIDRQITFTFLCSVFLSVKRGNILLPHGYLWGSSELIHVKHLEQSWHLISTM